jgi:SagB-type dehydrogenase family enzyme
VKVAEGDKRPELGISALGQDWVKAGAAVIVLSAVYERTTITYGERGKRYVHMEAGHAAQNACLQAVALNLGTVIVGAFDDREVRRVMSMSDKEQPLCIIPVGRK